MVKCFLLSTLDSNLSVLYKMSCVSSSVLAACVMVPPMNSAFLWLSSELLRIIDFHSV
jgi:hypothetical protein